MEAKPVNDAFHVKGVTTAQLVRRHVGAACATNCANVRITHQTVLARLCHQHSDGRRVQASVTQCLDFEGPRYQQRPDLQGELLSGYGSSDHLRLGRHASVAEAWRRLLESECRI